MRLSRVLIVGLILTAFAFNPWAQMDLRELKTALAVIFAIAIFGIQVYRGGLKPCNNKWFLIILAYLPASLFFAKLTPISIGNMNISEFWFWKPFTYFLAFTLMGLAIASHEFTEKELSKVFKVISWCGFLTAFYVILQRLGADQFFYSDSPDTGPYAGFIANPTLTAHYLAMSVPFVLLLRKWWMIPFLIAALLITDSLMAWGGLGGGMAFLVGSKGRIWAYSVGFLCLVAFGLLVANFPNGREHERFFRWGQVVKDTKTCSVTGRGLGRYTYFFQSENPGHGDKVNRFRQAHNDYLEWLYATGLIGTGLLFGAITHFFKNSFGFEYRRRVVMASLVTIMLIAFGCFDFQIGTMAFLTALLVGLLMNKEVIWQRSKRSIT